MRKFNVMSNPSGQYVAVKVGWCWPAFLFGWIWALFSRIWNVGIGVPVTFFILGFLSAAIGGSAGEALLGIVRLAGFVLLIIFGVKGNELRERNLESRGFEPELCVMAANKDAAIASFLKQTV